jgi:crotonobetainyl-CoA:carnitine CoA-transferase CaiB-like acyl-CoA transferase
MQTLPLKGIRILDMTVVWAGPYGATLLADLGAEVIRIESTQVMMPITRGAMARPPQAMIDNMPGFAGGFPDKLVGDHPWNRTPIFNSHGRNKLSMTVDLRVKRGREIFDKLLKVSDMFIDNNVRETMDKLNINYESLSSVKNDIIMIRMPAYGDSGEYSKFRSLGIHMADALGHGLMRGYTDMDPSANSGEFVVDASAGTHAAAAAIMALIHRKRTGKGQLIELPSAQATFGYMAESFMEYTFNGDSPSTLGNRHPRALQGCYQCMGDDRWIVITIWNDEQWNNFIEIIGKPEWSMKPEFTTHENRLANHNLLDVFISEWTNKQDHKLAMKLLQQSGIPAGAVLDAKDSSEDSHLASRNFYQEAFTEDTGIYKYGRAPFVLSKTPANVRRGPVMLGQDNEYVYKTILGISDSEYAELETEGHIGTEFHSDII